MDVREIVVAVPLCLAAASHAAGAGAPLVTHVRVRVYETAGLDAELKAAALAVADRTLASASVGVCKQCAGVTLAPPCDAPPGGELVVRIVRSPGAPPRGPLPLGDAYVDPAASSGVLATVYFDRVTRVAGAVGSSVGALLGYAIAHELGHLLLASNAHSTRGLMRPTWLPEELRRRRHSDWTFTNQEIAAIRSRLGQTAYGRPPF